MTTTTGLCEYQWNPGVWPYAERCPNRGELHSVKEWDGTERQVCDEHASSNRYRGRPIDLSDISMIANNARRKKPK